MTTGFELTCGAVLFDMDGTLVDSTAVVEAVWAEFAQRFDLDLADVLAYTHGRLTIDSVRHFCPAGEDPLALTAELDAEELTRLDGVVEVPGAAALLDALRGAPVAVVTSASRELATRRMRAAGIAVPPVMVGAEDVEVGKPSPQGYLRAGSRLGVPPTDCVVFEDAEAGLQAAVASGGQVVVVGAHRSPTTAGLPRVADLTTVVADRVGDRIRVGSR